MLCTFVVGYTLMATSEIWSISWKQNILPLQIFIACFFLINATSIVLLEQLIIPHLVKKPHKLWYPKFHYRVNKKQPIVEALCNIL